MLKGFEEDIAGIDLPDEVKAQLIEAANKRALGLSAKNGDVIGVNSTLKAQIAKLESDALEAKRKIAEEANDSAELARMKKEADAKVLQDIEDRAKALDDDNKKLKHNLTELLIDGGLSSALDSVRINPALKVGAVALLRADAVLADGKAMIGDKSLSDAVKEWAKSDAGKSYCLAASNNNGDGLGGGGDGNGSKKFSEMTMTEKTVLLNTDPTLYHQLNNSKG